MFKHLRACLTFAVLSLLICCVIYPLAVLGIARAFFPNRAEGSLVDGQGRLVIDPAKAVGSRLIGQPFSDDGYFWPRPSATTPAYNAAASGATNWSASNWQLRDRVARMLGTLVKYSAGPKKGQLVGPDVEAWFQQDLVGGKQPGIVAYWAKHYPSLAQAWVKSDPLITAYVADQLQTQRPDVVSAWQTENKGAAEPPLRDYVAAHADTLAGEFFEGYVQAHPGTWPSIQDQPAPDGKSTMKVVKSVQNGSDVQSYFFDLWLQEHADAELEQVPADMVMASSSGLDPHITLKNALYQLDRVAGTWAARTRRDPAQVRQEIEDLLHQQAAGPLGGLIGVDLINVLEMNLALRQRYAAPHK